MGRIDRVKKIVNVIVVFDILLIVTYFFIDGFSIIEFIKKTSYIVTASIFLMIAINKLLWKYKFLNIIFDSPPNLNGLWRGIIINKNDKKEQQIEIKIVQTYLELYITVKAERGNSITWVGDIVKINNNDWKLMWTWHSNNEAGDFSGTTILDVIDNFNLEGYYFTNSNIDGRGCTSGVFKAKKVK